MLYESIYSHPGVAHLNDLLRQQSENAYLNTKNQWILRFWADFLDFLIFSISDGFEAIWLSISTPWLDFLPGAASKSIWADIFIIFRFFSSYVFMCRFCKSESSAAIASWNLAPGPNSIFYILVSMSEADSIFYG